MILEKSSTCTTTIIAFAVIMVTGCSTGSDNGMGSLEVRLHDAPASYDQVNVVIESVEINRVGDPEGWITVSEPQQSFDLLKLANGAYEVLGEVQLEPGRYPQIRLMLGEDGHSVVKDGKETELFVPSGQQTGVKLEVNAEISEGIEYVLLLDFDADRSVVEAGDNPQIEYLLDPVIRATNKAATGNIEGTIDPAEAEPVVYAVEDADTVSSTYADTVSGYFRLVGLEKGTYTVSITPRNIGYEAMDTTGVQVSLGETSELGAVELGQSQ